MGHSRKVKARNGSDGARARTERLREKIGELTVERQAIEAAPVDQETAVAALRRRVDALAAQYEPRVRNFMGSGVPDWPLFDARDLERFIAWLCGKQLKEALQDALAKCYEAAPLALSPADKVAQLAELDAKLLELEVEEEQLVRQLEHEGIDIGRRPDADLEVVLDVM
ncbi:MAG: hypothetical protein Q8R92_10025 [Deltaproteobacteria bacterium]|nr:hypothetical protein [Deltaproteobacteria bacterium]